jgi:hypothetical protein
MTGNVIRPLDREALRASFQNAAPFPHMVIEDFLDPDFAREAAASYPGYGEARERGREFSAVNENFKVQITDPSEFPDPVRKLNDALKSEAFIKDLEYITGIDHLLYDELLQGGGMHLTGPRGRLDVHVDFNYIESRKLHRRLNILVYLNEDWADDWGGAVELWDEKVRDCAVSVKPKLNRCVVFATSEISFHGVEPVTCPPDRQRISFAAYYFTKEAPAHWDGTKHTTIFKARPNERLRAYVLMPFERARSDYYPAAKRAVKRLIGRS